MSNSIVQIAVSLTIAPAPSTLQRTGAFVVQGATNLAAGSTALLTQYADLTPLLDASVPVMTMTWLTNTVTVTLPANSLGLVAGETIPIVISGATPATYNGTYTGTVVTPTTVTFPLVVNPGTYVSGGMFSLESDFELVAMATTFFTQGTTASVNILELGPGDVVAGVPALSAWITANPGVFYSYLIPRTWDANPAFLSFLAQFEAPTAKTYFYVTTKLATYTSYTKLMKCVKTYIEAPSVTPLGLEFSAAADFYVNLNYNPSTTNKVTPNAFAFVFGVTPYPTKGNAALLQTLKTASVNVIGTGAQGGISDTIMLWGTTMDGRDFTYWYSVDWVQINLGLDITNEIINGSNNPLAPLYYDQNGINRLRARAQATMERGVTYGLVLAPVSVTAVDFPSYVTTNPSDYPAGIYNGLAVSYTPNRGFVSLLFNVNVTDFPAA